MLEHRGKIIMPHVRDSADHYNHYNHYNHYIHTTTTTTTTATTYINTTNTITCEEVLLGLKMRYQKIE